MRRCCCAKSGRPQFLIDSPHVRHSINGFALFTKELQMEKGVLKAKDLKKGQDNMKVISSHWKQLSNKERNDYNRRAREIGAMRVPNTEKAFNDFNLLMRLIYRSEDIAGAGDETFTARMVSNTMAQLNPDQKKKLRKEFVTPPTNIENKTKEQMRHISWYYPHMRYFDSFTDMLQSVAPTRKELFIAVSRVLRVNRTASQQSLAALNQKFESLKGTHLNKFRPIGEEDITSFEKYCASNCAGFDVHAFNIIRLFAQFRGLVTAKNSPKGQEAIQYKMLMEADRFRESLYFKALRNLERAKAGRTADHGTYISYFYPDGVSVPPKTYGIETHLNDVHVATLLAETRFGRSVYDDVLERTGCFRSKEANQLLRETYINPTSKKKGKE
ncbi:hypothetical protein, conserved [Trypanosoma brucei gambiense DAL972]|uniref:HMG box domain-containing protein n=2 Tax=Trypanosoma brucei TaxID=5691 RepID=C9ZXP9_TRYB9|nr:hypothetical protein, conserved [Trypanosoma brucei gambiense DAL972]RHW70120.1 HMG-box domain containing protein [Trypanosoma brucei equiperdum]CBH14194.1 hypothetical protein, conserved [Trypanosoma brucei gambiense DAL972]|eukprot:XP_011776464.1 hypothetical protein, conserved [Trypanosoma brucei gambiense DAL972]